MEKKRGKLGKAEETFILQNVHELSIEEIAKALNRTTEPVTKFIREKNLKHTAMGDDQYERNLLLKKLRERKYFPEIVSGLTDEELPRFEQDWVEVFLQFKSNVLYTEELDIKKYLMLEIRGDRCLRASKESILEVNKLKEQLEEKLSIPVDDREADHSMQVMMLNQQIAAGRDAEIAFTRQHKEILEKIRDIQKSLKANRDDRIRQVDDSKGSFSAYIRMLEDEQRRRDAGEDAEIKRLAKNAARQRLSQYHRYQDGKIDQPLLSAETVILEQEIDDGKTEEGTDN